MDAAGNLYRALGTQVTVTSPGGGVRQFAAGFIGVEGIAIDRAAGIIYIADLLDASIRVYDVAGTSLRTIGRSGESGYRDGPAADALFAGPSVLALDPAGNLYIADNSNTIRKHSRDGVVRTIAGIAGASGVEPGGVNAPLGRVRGMAVSGGALYFTVENAVLRISPVP